MKFSATGMYLLKLSEGFRSRIYRDANGLSTIGYGHRLLPTETFPNGIDEPHAAALLALDVCASEEAVERLVKVPLTQGQFDALVDFCFNLGRGRLTASSLLADLNAGKYDEAARQLLLWDHADGHEIAALKARREAEAVLWRGNEKPSQVTA
jgi:lysozyme